MNHPDVPRGPRISFVLGLVFGVALSLLGSATMASAAGPPCRPCAGIWVEEPGIAIDALAAGLKVEGEARLYVVWPTELDGNGSNAAFEAVRRVGGTPWTLAIFRSPAPIQEHLDTLQNELEALSALALDSGERAHFQLTWRPSEGEATTKDFAYLVKRAAVVVTGAQADARVLAGPLVPDAAALQEFYAENVAAYVDGVALQPGGSDDQVKEAIGAIRELDPGKPIVLDRLSFPKDESRSLALTAESAQKGFAVTLFRFTRDAAALNPLKLLAREFQGDMSYDPYTVPTGAARAWTYVKGEDLSLRVIAEAEPEASQVNLFFKDPQLRSPRVFDYKDGFEGSVFGQKRTGGGLLVPLESPAPVSVVKVERMTAAELEGLEEEVQVDDSRQMPVEEILRRLQAFEDAQTRKVDHYQARNILHLRFEVGTGTGGVEASFDGDFFFRQGQGFDWTWEDFYFNGVKWKGKKLPELPILQPEKAAVLPLTINFTKEYTYRLRGTEVVDGHDCWVVDFEPAVAAEPGKSLYQGTVWVDREIYARVKTRSLQLGLDGEVLSNDETVYFNPVDTNGQPAAWSPDSYFLPTRIVGQQVWSLLNAAIQVERESLLSAIRINGDDFESERQVAMDSDATMVRDTEEGLRYLIKDESGERVVQEEFDTSRFFLAGGIFYDESQEFPIPLAGVNYLDLDFRDSGGQLNVLFAGPFLTVNLAQPRLFESKWDFGGNVNGIFIDFGDELYRDGEEVPMEEIEQKQSSVSLFLGRQLGNYAKLDFTAGLSSVSYGRADDTAEDFVLPEDTLIQSYGAELTYSRSGYRFKAEATLSQRQDWEFWGLPDNTEFDPEQEDYLRWAVSLGKTWWLPNFTKFGVELEHLSGEDLDRFSKYDFGLFSSASVAGYPSGLVRAEEVNALSLTYGVGVSDLLQVEIDGDVAWATDEATGLDNELLAGIGLEGTIMGPWETILNFEVGVPVAGPGDGYSARLVFLKLFDGFDKWFKKDKKKD